MSKSISDNVFLHKLGAMRKLPTKSSVKICKAATKSVDREQLEGK